MCCNFICYILQLKTSNNISPASLEGEEQCMDAIVRGIGSSPFGEWFNSAIPLTSHADFSALSPSFLWNLFNCVIYSKYSIKIRKQYIQMGLKCMRSSCLFRNVCSQKPATCSLQDTSIQTEKLLIHRSKQNSTMLTVFPWKLGIVFLLILWCYSVAFRWYLWVHLLRLWL